jgi:hypothetical protein
MSTRFAYDTLEEALKDVVYFVEATSLEQWHLQRDWSVDSKKSDLPDYAKLEWGDTCRGWWRTLGTTTVNFTFVYISKQLVCFFNPSSRKVDWDEIYAFIDPYDVRRSNAGNFNPPRPKT